MTGRQWKEGLLAAFFPDRCAYCGRVVPHPDRLCPSCEAQLPVIEPPTCPHCGCSDEDCTCDRHRHPYDRVLAPLYYQGVVITAILRLKEQERPYIVRELAGRMIRTFIQKGESRPDGVTFVPMTPKDERERGFNQSRLLAAEVADGLGVPLMQTIQKIQHTRPQKSLPALERSGNVLGVFDAVLGMDVAGKRMVLVDDLVTTGATAGECAKVLKLYGAKEVVLLTAAVTVDKITPDTP